LIRQGVEDAQSIRTERQAEAGGTAAQASSFQTILAGQTIVIRKNSTGVEIVQPRINLIEGANITITIADDSVNSEADVTFALSSSPDVATSYKVAGNKVLGARGAAVADVTSPDATDLASAITLANELKARLNTFISRFRVTGGHGSIDD
jgi:hypothetical protein